MHMVANTNASLRDGETPSSENSLALAPISVVDNSTLSLSLSLSLSIYLSLSIKPRRPGDLDFGGFAEEI